MFQIEKKGQKVSKCHHREIFAFRKLEEAVNMRIGKESTHNIFGIVYSPGKQRR